MSKILDRRQRRKANRRISRVMCLATALVGVLAALNVAKAAPICGEHGQLIETLGTNFKETPQAIGLTADGALIQVMVSPSGGWSILVTYPKGPSCIIAAGQDWQSRIVLPGQSS